MLSLRLELGLPLSHRLARSTSDLYRIISELAEKGVN